MWGRVVRSDQISDVRDLEEGEVGFEGNHGVPGVGSDEAFKDGDGPGNFRFRKEAKDPDHGETTVVHFTFPATF